MPESDSWMTLHGIFDKGDICKKIIGYFANEKGIIFDDDLLVDYASYKEQQYDKLAYEMRKHLDMDEIYRILG